MVASGLVLKKAFVVVLIMNKKHSKMNFFKKLFGNKSSNQDRILESEDSSYHIVDLNTAQMMESNAETISYNGGNIESFYEEMSRELIKHHGKLIEVDFLTHFPKYEMYFTYEDGMRLYSGKHTGDIDIHILSLGYVGQGPKYAQHFLGTAGFNLTTDQIESIRPGDSIKLKDGIAIIEKKNEKVNETDSEKVKFSHERNEIVYGAPAIYRHYTAPDEKSAMSFLENQNITAQSYFVVVDTPEGTFSKDRMGIF